MAGNRVVLVDDQEAVVESLVRALEAFGIHALGATSSDRAYELFAAEQCDVLVVDYLMGAETGLDLIERIKKLRPQAKVILISGWIDHSKLPEEELNRDLQARVGCDYYLPKPFSNEQLATAIHAAISDLDNTRGDWKALASQYVKGGRLDPSEVRALNERIKANLKTIGDRES